MGIGPASEPSPLKNAIMGSNIRDVYDNRMAEPSTPNESPLAQSLLHLDKVVAGLDETIEVLYSTTMPIRNDPPRETSSERMSRDSESHSPVVSALNDKVERLQYLTSKIHILLNQLEV